MSLDLLGPANAPNTVTVRPADARVFGTGDTWFKGCSAVDVDDGTEIDAPYLNGMLAQLRRAIRGQGVTENNADDDMLLKAIQSAGIRYAVDHSGVANQIVVSNTRPLTTHIEGALLAVKAINTVTWQTTFTPDAIDAKYVRHPDGTDLGRGDWAAGAIGLIMFDGDHYQLLAVFGNARGAGIVATFNGLTGAASTGVRTAQWTIGEIVVGQGGVAPVAPSRRLAGLTLNFDGATVGAGGMDTGVMPTSGDLCVYAIYNPQTNVAAVLGCRNSVSNGPMYGGLNMPAGFSESALIWSGKTDAGGNFAPFVQKNRKIHILPTTVFSGRTGGAGYLPQSISVAVPPVAQAVSGTLFGGTYGPGGATVGAYAARPRVASAGGGNGEQYGGGSDGFIPNFDATLAFSDLALYEPQNIYWQVGTAGFAADGSGSCFLQICNYTI